MREVKIRCRKCDCCSLPCSIGKKIREYEAFTRTFTKRIRDRTNQNKKVNRRTQSKGRDKGNPSHPLSMEVLINNNNNNKKEQ